MSVNKRELGKGIRSLLGNMDLENKEETQKVVAVLSNTVAMISVEAIELNPFQPRKDFDENSLKELSQSIVLHGLIQPITVRRFNDKQYQLISGERRLRASKLAGLKEIPAYIRLATNDQEMLEMALVENIQREDLNAIEVAIQYQRLMDEINLTHEQISERVGKERSTITNYIRLLKLPEEIKLAIKAKRISMGHARALIGIESDIALQLTIFKEIILRKLSVREVEELIRKYKESRQVTKPKINKLPDEYKNVQDSFSAFFGSKVQLKANGDGKGQIVISFSNTDELNRMLEVLDK